MHNTLKLQGEEGFNPCTCLLVQSWRMIMSRGVECPLINKIFKDNCGCESKTVFRAFCTFLCALAFARRKCLIVSTPGQTELTGDEMQMLALIAAAQHQQEDMFHLHLEAIAEHSLRKTLRDSVLELAEVLKNNHLHLPQPA